MGAGDQRHAPAAFTPGKDPIPIVQEAGVRSKTYSNLTYLYVLPPLRTFNFDKIAEKLLTLLRYLRDEVSLFGLRCHMNSEKKNRHFVRRYLMRESDIFSCDICNTLHM
jgi:hypothetical protein